mmetsp:Transcript_7860/g.28747  ORF Transcript_7860/g.28747 Transcript_7860/m.28747 type:complete len:247 (-) Transcript_7860:300-1040(-)
MRPTARASATPVRGPSTGCSWAPTGRRRGPWATPENPCCPEVTNVLMSWTLLAACSSARTPVIVSLTRSEPASSKTSKKSASSTESSARAVRFDARVSDIPGASEVGEQKETPKSSKASSSKTKKKTSSEKSSKTSGELNSAPVKQITLDGARPEEVNAIKWKFGSVGAMIRSVGAGLPNAQDGSELRSGDKLLTINGSEVNCMSRLEIEATWMTAQSARGRLELTFESAEEKEKSGEGEAVPLTA